MQNYLTRDRAGLAYRNAPVFFFGQMHRHPPCIPTWAYQGSPSSPDIYDQAHRTKPAKRCFYEDVGCDCRTPGVGIGHRAPPFPIYFTIRGCSTREIRVVLNLFYQKDGAICTVPFRRGYNFDVGHEFDWERVTIVYRRSTRDGLWSADYIFMSQHGGYKIKAWSDIRITLSERQAMSPDPRIFAGPPGQDHPVVYVGWLKHPHFDSKDTFPWGWLVQLSNKAFRSDDWWLLVDRTYLIEASAATVPGRIMGTQDWGEADSIPPKVDHGICTVSLQEGFVMMNNTGKSLSFFNETFLASNQSELQELARGRDIGALE